MVATMISFKVSLNGFPVLYLLGYYIDLMKLYICNPMQLLTFVTKVGTLFLCGILFLCDIIIFLCDMFSELHLKYNLY